MLCVERETCFFEVCLGRHSSKSSKLGSSLSQVDDRHWRESREELRLDNSGFLDVPQPHHRARHPSADNLYLYYDNFDAVILLKMPGTYFFPRLLLAFAVPLVLASLGPAESHPELGTDMASARKKSQAEVYRAEDVQVQVGLEEARKMREVTTIQAYRKGQRIHVKRKE
jgi:hypothetical protein